MSLENEDHNLLDHSANHELLKKFKITYTRDLLLSLSELDCCKELPSGFDRSLLCELEDASQDRQRSTGGLSMHCFRRNEYGSSPPSRGDASSYSRGTHGKWDTRSSGRSDRDNDSQSEWDSDSGRRFGNQSRKSWQGPEHDGLLGSGSFPRPSGYTPGLSAQKFRPNSNYQLNRSNEPYHPPRPYKAPHSRRDTDSYNDETFGSLDDTSEDRVEEERKRRASFELMRKEQQKAFQEKQKFNPDKNRDEFDITSLLDDDEKRLVNRSRDSMEPTGALLASSNDSEKSSFLSHAPSASRPLVPPGFTSSVLEKNLVAKSSVSIHPKEDGQSGLEDCRGNYVFSTNSENKDGKSSTKQADINQQHPGSTSVSFNNEKEKILNLSSRVDVPNINIGMGNQLMKKSALSEALEASDDSEVVRLNVEVKGKDTIGAFNVDNSNSILEKLFGSALTLNGGKSPNAVEPNHKADETWSPHAFQSSKFALWFDEEEKRAVHEITPRPNDLLSLIVGGEKGGLQVLDLKAAQQSAPENPDTAVGHMTSNAYTTISNSEKPCKSDKAEVVPAVLTCEDLEQSILSQISENGSSLEQPVQDKDFDSMTERLNSSVDDNASQHLLSLLQKGTSHKDMDPSSILDLGSTDKVHDTDGVAFNKSLDNSVEANTDVSNSSKTLTLETLFGTAFMQELQSVGAPLSVQRGAIESSGVDVSGPLQFPFSVSDNGLPPTGVPSLNRLEAQGLPSESIQQHKPNRLEEKWLGYDDPQGAGNSSQLGSEFSIAGGVNGPTDFQLPEEDSLISVNDPLQNFIATGNSGKTKLFQDTPVDIAGKLAALNPALRGEQTIMGNQESIAYSRGPHDMREPGIPYQNLNVQQSSPQLHPSQLNHMGPIFNQLDSHSPRISSYMKFMTPEGMVHNNSPLNHQFPGNLLRPPFHQGSTGLTGLNSPSHHSMLQQIPMPGNFPPSQLRGFPRGAPLPVRPGNPMAGFMQEPNPPQGLPFSSHQQPTFGGPGMPHQAPDVAGGRNHPEALQKLFEMELRSNPKQIHPFAAGGHSQGMHGHGLDLNFGYR